MSRWRVVVGLGVLVSGILIGICLPTLFSGFTNTSPAASLAQRAYQVVPPPDDQPPGQAVPPQAPIQPPGPAGPGPDVPAQAVPPQVPIQPPGPPAAEPTKPGEPSIQPPPALPGEQPSTSPLQPGQAPPQTGPGTAVPVPTPPDGLPSKGSPVVPGQAPLQPVQPPGQVPGQAPPQPGPGPGQPPLSPAPTPPDGLPPKGPSGAPQAPRGPGGKLPPNGSPGAPLPPVVPPFMFLPPGPPGNMMLPPGALPGVAPLPGAPPAAAAPAGSADLAYGSDPLQHLDLYQPRTAGAAPMLLFVHGGGWSIGDKSELSWLGAKLAEQGVLVAVANYRLSPAVQHPAHAQDVARAVAWLYRNASAYGGDPQHFYLGGHSAGAQLAALVALDGSYLAAEGLSPSVVHGVVGISGAGYDLDARYVASPLAQLYAAAFGKDPTRWSLAAPLHYVDKSAPPFLLIHGLGDTEAPVAGAQVFAQALKGNGAQVRLDLLPGVDHQGALLTALPSLRAFLQ